MKKNKPAPPSIIVYLTSSSITFIAPELELLQVFPLSSECVTHLDVTKKDQLDEQLKKFISQIGLHPGNCVLIFDPTVYFLKETSVTTPAKKSDNQEENGEKGQNTELSANTFSQTELFVQEIKKLAPYQNPFVKDIIIGSTHYTIVVNRNFYEPILATLTQADFFVSTLIPSIVIQDLLDGQQLSLELGNSILKSGTARFKKHNFLSYQRQKPESDSLISREKPDTKKIIALGGVFVVLIGVLVYMIMNMESVESPPPTQHLNPVTSSAPQNTPIETVPSPTATASAEPEIVLDLSPFTVQIYNGSGKTGQAAQLRDVLLDAGFQTVETGNTSTLTASRTVVVFAQNLPEEVKQLVSETLANVSLSFSSVTSSDAEADIVITTVVSSTINTE